MMHFHAPGYPSLFFNDYGVLPGKEGPCYFSKDGKGSPRLFMEEYARQRGAIEGLGFVSIPSANHDFQRWRCGPRGWEELRGMWVFLLTQAGPPTLYYGDEIGMRHVPGLGEKEGSTLWGVTAANAGQLGGEYADGERSGTRTPMQWEPRANAGFSTADPEMLYLPLDPEPDRPTVEEQSSDPTSLLQFVKNLLAFRKRHPALSSKGTYEWIDHGSPYPLVVRRCHNDQCFWILLNPSGEPVEVSFETDHPVLSTPFIQDVEWRETAQGVQATLNACGYAVLQVDAHPHT